MATNVKSRASALAAGWGRAKEEAKSSFGEAVPVKPGAYTMQLVDKEIGDFGGKRQVMLSFVVVGCDEESNGSICKMWLVLDDEERLVWLVRALEAMGVDTGEFQPQDEDELAEKFDELIAANTVCKVKVREKDSYTNMYLNGLADVSTDDLVDPAEARRAMKAGASKPSGTAKSKSAAAKPEPEDGVSEGDRVTWKSGKVSKSGEIVAFDKDDNAIVKPDGEKKTVVVSLDQLEREAEAEADGDGDGDGGEAPEVEVGSIVSFDIDGKRKSGVVAAIKGGKASVNVRGAPKPISVSVDELEVV